MPGTYYINSDHGNTRTIPLHKGTLQGDTLSPVPFTIFMEPLLRWLSIGGRGYKPMQQSEQAVGTYMSYDDHGYSYDFSNATGTLYNLQIQIKKLILFSKYTGLVRTRNDKMRGHRCTMGICEPSEQRE